MNNIKTWWTTKGWPWLKENWWVVLLLPLMALAFVGWYLMTKENAPTVIEPLAAADERAKTEAETRARQLEQENARLTAQLSELQTKYNTLQASMETRIASDVDGLRADPDKLRDAMLAAGKG